MTKTIAYSAFDSVQWATVSWRPIDERLFEHTGHVLLWVVEHTMLYDDTPSYPIIVWTEHDRIIKELGEAAGKDEFLETGVIGEVGRNARYCTHYAIISPPQEEAEVAAPSVSIKVT